ncbi:MAG: hypothetical protein QNK23_01100 [Crocinitomicaceae bacterium]|nr:hypothetical protein [Crocinitomicaceae bacterium]
MKCFFFALVLGLFFSGCDNSSLITGDFESEVYTIECTNNACNGTYVGAEFIGGSDIAHQLSNAISEVVGDKLKELYKNGRFSKVDFSAISMTTEGMGTGQVTYQLTIPFSTVEEKCSAYTSFDHVGGWNHEPALSSRISQLKKALIPEGTLDVSELMTTPEGLQEYWIQWKNNVVQSKCADTHE